MVLLIAGCSDQASKPPVEQERTISIEQFVFELPEVEGWSASSPSHREDGISVSYVHAEHDLKTTISQYNRGHTEITSVLEDVLVKEEFEASCERFKRDLERENYKVLGLVDSGIFYLGGNTDVLHASYVVKREGVASIANISVWTYQNQFLEIRRLLRWELSDDEKAANRKLDEAFAKAAEPEGWQGS